MGWDLNKEKRKKVVTIFGNIVTIVSLLYLLIVLFENAGRIAFVFSSIYFLIFFLFISTYLIHSLILKTILNKELSFFTLVKINSTAQIHKYLPGNIAQYFSRWLYLRNRGVDTKENARLIFLETFLLVVTYFMFGLFFVFTTKWKNPLEALQVSLSDFNVFLVLGLFFLLFLLIGYFFRKKLRSVFNLKNLLVVLLYTASAFVFGLILYLLNNYVIKDISGIGFLSYTLGFAASFVIGFVFPGSPGGIGIREFVFVEIFKHSGNEVFLLTQLIICFRLLSIFSELIIYFASRVFIRDGL